MTFTAVNHRTTVSNDVLEMFQVLGIEGARSSLFNELRNVLSFDGKKKILFYIVSLILNKIYFSVFYLCLCVKKCSLFWPLEKIKKFIFPFIYFPLFHIFIFFYLYLWILPIMYFIVMFVSVYSRFLFLPYAFLFLV